MRVIERLSGFEQLEGEVVEGGNGLVADSLVEVDFDNIDLEEVVGEEVDHCILADNLEDY